MEAHEATELKEHIEGEHPAAHTPGADNALRRIAGIYVGIVAVLLAIASLGGSRAMKEMLNANIHAADTYAFAQAKHIRATTYHLAAAQLELQLAAQPTMPDPAKTRIAEAIKDFRATAAHEDNDPKTGEGRTQLLAEARQWEATRDHAREQDPNFELAEALYQIAIVLGSVSIVAASPALLWFSGGVATLGIVLTLNGFFLLVPMPLG